MDLEEVQKRLEGAGLKLKSRQRLPNEKGYQLRFKTGEIVNVFDTGSVVPQGKNAGRVLKILGIESAEAVEIESAPRPSRKVFVIYGHDDGAKTQIEAMLRRWDLEPLILDQLPSEGQTVIEKLEKYTREDVRFAVALATPDDEGYARGKEDEKRFRARQNVVLELGLLLAKLGRHRVAILLKNQEKMERPSDIQGLIYFPFTDNVEDAKVLLAKEMEKQGLEIDIAKL